MLRVVVLAISGVVLVASCMPSAESEAEGITQGVIEAEQSVSDESAEPTCKCHGQPATICGKLRSEVIPGTDDDDIINGRGGRDVVHGGAGDDTICGGGGGDVLYGDDGDDTIYGGPGNDYIDGGDGYDTCYRGGPNNTVVNCEVVI